MVSSSVLTRFLRDWAVVVILGALALLGTARVGEDVFAHESTAFDAAVQRWMLAHETPWLDSVFIVITNAGGVVPVCVLSAAGAGYLWYREKRRVAATVLLAPVAAVAGVSGVQKNPPRARPRGGWGHLSPPAFVSLRPP